MQIVGNVSSILGLVVALAGFYYTIRVARQARGAAEKARDAAIDAQAKLLQFDVIAEISAAIGVMEEIRRLHRQQTPQAWPIALDRYAEARKYLTRVQKGYTHLSNRQRATLQDGIQYLRGFEDHVEWHRTQKTAPAGVATLNRIISAQIDNLNALLMEMRNMELEVAEQPAPPQEST